MGKSRCFVMKFGKTLVWHTTRMRVHLLDNVLEFNIEKPNIGNFEANFKEYIRKSL